MPDNVGSGRRLLKNPHFHKAKASSASTSKPSNIATTYIHQAIPSSSNSGSSGYACVSACKVKLKKNLNIKVVGTFFLIIQQIWA